MHVAPQGAVPSSRPSDQMKHALPPLRSETTALALVGPQHCRGRKHLGNLARLKAGVSTRKKTVRRG
eukprot:9476049-Pyramimonas_sp.AAC.1